MIIKNISRITNNENISFICPMVLNIGTKNYLFFSFVDKSNRAKIGYYDLLIEDQKINMKEKSFTKFDKINKLKIFKDGCIVTSILKDRNSLIFFVVFLKNNIG